MTYRQLARQHRRKGEPGRAIRSAFKRKLRLLRTVGSRLKLVRDVTFYLVTVASYVLMLLPIGTKLDQVLWTLGVLFGVTSLNIGKQIVWVGDTLGGGEISDLLPRQRHQTDVAPQLQFLITLFWPAFAAHGNVRKRLRCCCGVGRGRYWQVPLH